MTVMIGAINNMGELISITEASPEQLATIAINPPNIYMPPIGSMVWDITDYIDYTADQTIMTDVEFSNPGQAEELYGLVYYFIDPNGNVVAQDYVYFTTGSMQFASFILYPDAPAPMTTTISFSAPAVGYKFGLRLLQLQMNGSVAEVVQEVNRLEVKLGGTNPTPTPTTPSIGLNTVVPMLIDGMIMVSFVGMTMALIKKLTK